MSVLSLLFRDKLNRAKLLALSLEKAEKTIMIAVHRNHSFELIAPILNVFLNRCGAQAEFWYSDYDDSLSFASVPAMADIHLIWIDAARYALPDVADWLLSRISTLREKVSGKVLVACCGIKEKELSASGAVFLDVDGAIASLGSTAFNSRLQELSGTRLSNEAMLLVARELGLRYVPALLQPALKAIILDCDNTLYAGVLSEDGIDGVKPHVALQTYLKNILNQGFMLALVSKNAKEDVKELFMTRKDFPLQWGDFVAQEINWNPKPENIARIAATLNIGMDSILFVDDNPGETAQVRHTLPELHVIEAASPEETLAALRWQPGLFKTIATIEDTLRNADIKANAARARLKAVSPGNYLRDLELELAFFVNPLEQAGRIEELLHKTNQFILSLERPDSRAVTGFLSDSDRCIVAAAMKDRLSDSGIIAVLLASTEAKQLAVVDLAISCRALGRGVEGAMICTMVRLAAQRLNTGDEIKIAYRKGPRNAPALTWLENLSGNTLNSDAGTVKIKFFPHIPLDGIATSVDGRRI